MRGRPVARRAPASRGGEERIMEWDIPDSERTYLRELARKQAEYAALPGNALRPATEPMFTT